MYIFLLTSEILIMHIPQSLTTSVWTQASKRAEKVQPLQINRRKLGELGGSTVIAHAKWDELVYIYELNGNGNDLVKTISVPRRHSLSEVAKHIGLPTHFTMVRSDQSDISSARNISVTQL